MSLLVAQRLTLLLGPPGCGKTTLLKALSGNLDKDLKVSDFASFGCFCCICMNHVSFLIPQRSGEISYNGHGLNEFVPQKTSAYISQHDLHIAEMTVRETIDFSARCQGVGSRTGRFIHKATVFLSLKHCLKTVFMINKTDIIMEVSKREKDGGIIPDPEVDAYMKVQS